MREVNLLALTDAAADRPPAGTSAAERLAMVQDLSLMAWRLTGRAMGPGPRTCTVATLRPLRAPDLADPDAAGEP